MKHSRKESPVVVVLLLVSIGVLLGTLGGFGYMHGRSHRRYLVSAVTRQIDLHTSQIGDLILKLHSENPSRIEDAVYDELQRPPSTSLITRDMVSLRQSAGAIWVCVIDLSSLGLEPRQIREASKP